MAYTHHGSENASKVQIAESCLASFREGECFFLNLPESSAASSVKLTSRHCLW